jgi:hypothetical protein
VKPTTTTTRTNTIAAALLLALLCAPAAQAQLDPLISLKRVPPRILIVFDTSFSMLYDMTAADLATGQGAVYCDPTVYQRDPAVDGVFDLKGNTRYRRSFTNLAITATGYTATGIGYVTDGTPAAFANWCTNTRYEIARRGVKLALERSGNPRLHWGLLALRQTTPQWRVANQAGCKQVSVPSLTAHDVSPCNTGVDGLFAFNPPTVGGSNESAGAATPLLTAKVNQAAALVTGFFDAASVPLPTTSAQATANKLIPAGIDTATAEDRPLASALTDAMTEVQRAIGADSAGASRNTVVVLITGGKDYSGDPATRAISFKVGSHRVPIIVVGVSPRAGDESQLSAIGRNSGGLYVRATDHYGVERAINLAIQAGCQRPTELDAATPSEFLFVSPVVGTVNLAGAHDVTGTDLQHDVIYTATGSVIPQRNNMLLTAGFALGPASLSLDGVTRTETADWNPGFEGRLRAFRAFKPVVDSTKPSGYTFTKDGTPLWPSPDRPEWAGIARTPANPNTRNIFTYLPNGEGMTAFTTVNAEALRAALNVDDPGRLIEHVRRLPLGAIVSSTPAVMDPPSLDPPPDDDYGRPEAETTYAGRHKDRRAIIWVGANDGMLHAIDARTGYEVWAFIPYNLLPKLQTLLDGQSPYEFTYFMDQSPKIAEVKVDGAWRSMLIIGQGWGGTFYQAFDVTEAGMGGAPPGEDGVNEVLLSFANPDRVTFQWAFPDYRSFDPAAGGGKIYMQVADTTSFGRVKFFGDLQTTATEAEKTVGFTWSDPAVGALNATRTVAAAIVGSGYFPPEAEQATSPLLARRGIGVGRALYLIDMKTGRLVGGGSTCGGTGCIDVGDAPSSAAKNALHADPTVTSDYGSHVAKKAYMGDLDGKYWRFVLNDSGVITKTSLKDTGQPIYASSALMWVGSTQQFIFFSTGSDMLPTSPRTTYRVGDFRLFGLRDSSGTVSDAFAPVLLATVDNAVPEDPPLNGGVKDYKGSTIGIPVGERPSASPSVAGEIVFFTTTVEGGVPAAATSVLKASADPIYNFYAVTYQGSNGYPPAGSATGGDTGGGKGKGGGGGEAIAPIKTGTGRATAPFVVDQHLYFATTSASGASVEAFGDPNDFNNGVGQVGVRILSWREIRR